MRLWVRKNITTEETPRVVLELAQHFVDAATELSDAKDQLRDYREALEAIERNCELVRKNDGASATYLYHRVQGIAKAALEGATVVGPSGDAATPPPTRKDGGEAPSGACPHGRLPAPPGSTFAFAGGIGWCECCSNSYGVLGTRQERGLCATCRDDV